MPLDTVTAGEQRRPARFRSAVVVLVLMCLLGCAGGVEGAATATPRGAVSSPAYAAVPSTPPAGTCPSRPGAGAQDEHGPAVARTAGAALRVPARAGRSCPPGHEDDVRATPVAALPHPAATASPAAARPGRLPLLHGVFRC
ncbi:hypothetical protein AB0P15_29005 [Streptomyces sp. NPDC087917]|uniref:hypothetical protein n=1 Tax=unclassified Streptomyces TaxID=2593676 RepID=UPI003444B379